MQELLLADDLFGPLEQGTKTVTIRRGHKPLHTGLLAFVGASNPGRRCLVQVLEVRHTLLERLGPQDLAGYPVRNVADLPESLRRHYPDIGLKSEVTYVRFARVEQSGLPTTP